MGLRVFVVVVVAFIAMTSWVATCALSHYRKVAAGIAPLDRREFESLTLITVGTGGAYENPQRLGPCLAVGFGSRVVLVDAGRSVAEGLRAARIPVSQPDTLFLTSLLPENVLGLDDLLLTGWLTARRVPLRLVGPPGTRALADAIVQAHGPSVRTLSQTLAISAEGAGVEIVEIEGGWEESREGLGVRAAALEGGPLAGRAYRFEAERHAVVAGGTGWDSESLVALAKGADVLVHEALHGPSVEMAIEAGTEHPERLRREAALHTRTDEVGSLASRAGVRTLVLVRLRPPPLYAQQFRSLVGKSFAGEVVIAKDGQEIKP